MNVATVCVLLLAVAVVQIYCKKSKPVCYHPGMTCKSNGKGGGSYWLLAAQDYLPPEVLYGTGGHGNGGGSSWLVAMQESRDRANAKLAAVKAFMCDCCCASVPCSQESLCGTDRNCPVNDCFAHILGTFFLQITLTRIICCGFSQRKPQQTIRR